MFTPENVFDQKHKNIDNEKVFFSLALQSLTTCKEFNKVLKQNL